METYSSTSTKSAKTQFTNYLFIINTILYCYKNPNIIIPKIFYFPLEETPENITVRFMSFLINYITNGKIKISPTDLRSTDERKPLSNEVLDIMKTKEFLELMDLYESIIIFHDARNPTGIYKYMKSYAETNGTTHYQEITINGELGEAKTIKKFDYYEPNRPNEYVFIIVDHVSLIETEMGLTLRESINKLSEYMIIFRNRYNYIPVIVQQQGLDTTSLDAFKNNKIRPTMAGLSDSKYTAKDANVMFGLTNPHAFELAEYLGYDIKTLKGRARFLEIVLNRDGLSNGICPLFFEGAICAFKELPLPNSPQINQVYDCVKAAKVFFIYTFNKLFKH